MNDGAHSPVPEVNSKISITSSRLAKVHLLQSQPQSDNLTADGLDNNVGHKATGKRTRAQTAPKALVNGLNPSPHQPPRQSDSANLGIQRANQTSAAQVQGRTPSSRTTRVMDPAAPDRKRPKRTSEQVATDKAIHEQLMLELEDLEHKKKLLIAEMEIDQEVNDELEEAEALRKPSDRQSMGTSNDRYSDRSDDEDAADLSETPKPKKARKTKKERRDAFDVETERMRAKVIAKRSESGQPPISGFVANWRDKVRTPIKSKPTAVKPLAYQPGGLDDVDGFDAPSHKYGQKGLGQSRGRMNKEVLFVESDEEALVSSSQSHRKPAAQRPLKTQTPQVSRAPALPPPNLNDDGVVLVATSSDGGQALPEDLQTTWARSILPTLYHALFCADDPFTFVTKGDQFVQTIQYAVNLVHKPGAYTVSCTICNRAYDRLCEKRGHFASTALGIVKKFFKDTMSNDEDRVAVYAQWALRTDGPAMYKTPTPMDSAAEGEEDYIEPQGAYESQFIIDTLASLLKPIKKSNDNFGYPKSAVALAAAGVELAFSLHESGVFDEKAKEDFSYENVSPIVTEHLENIAQFSDRRWSRVLAATGFAAAKPRRPESHPSSLQRGRRNLNVSSSPTRGED
ncbi:hypothetical protein HGRIS_000845 [Hohenbuehelia grisea]|uniref:DUF6532 domain-containing protein n=1 Tax=Hohenbuehelia grisea TaxID=104357 RepID=A0ABR3IPX6_9AGAR